MRRLSVQPNTAGILPRSEQLSYYRASLGSLAEFPLLKGSRSADVAIIGGGLTGISAALELAKRGYKTCLLESHYPGWGASGRNGGQLLVGFACPQQALEKQLGREDARRLFAISCSAVQLVKDRIREYEIHCDYADGHIHTAIWPYQVKQLKSWQAKLQFHYDYPTQFWNEEQLREQINSERYQAGMFDPFCGHLHPLKYANQLALTAQSQGAELFQQANVLKFEKEGAKIRLHSNQGEVLCNNLLLATNAYLGGLESRLANYIMPVGTYIMATEPLGQERATELIRHNHAVADINFVLDYFRLSADHRLLFGGEVSYSTLSPLSIQRSLRRRMLRVFPRLENVRLDYAWGGMVGITLNRAPQLGKLANNIYYAHGFSGHGLAMSGMAGLIMAEAIAGEQEKLALFERIRHSPFPGGRALRMPLLVLAGLYGRLQDLFGSLR